MQRVTDPEVPKLIQSIYGIPAPATPRNDLVEIYLTGVTTKAGGPIKADLNSQLNNADVNPRRFQPAEELRLNLNLERLNLLGFSHGGMVAMSYAVAHPDQVERLVLANTLARFGEAQQAEAERAIATRAAEP